MADIDFSLEDNTEGDHDEDDIEGEFDDSSMLDREIPEEMLPPLAKMDRYMNSEIIFSRQMAARCVLECLRSVKTEQECYQVLQLMVRISDDIEATVRVEVMEQIPHIAVLCVEHRGLYFAIPQYILPVVVRYLTDPNNQVRKTSQAALLLLLEQEVIEGSDVEQQICPVLIELSSIDSTDDFRTEAVTLMSKMAPMVGREITERYFLSQFDNLCADPLFHVRKVCAASFGEMCDVVGNELTETRLLPVFIKLCQDSVWGVRKACAECFMSVSTVTCKDVRRNELAPLFINLLADKSRWVQMAAYQSLGPFISTFADPHNSGFYLNEMGQLCTFENPAVKTVGESSAEETVSTERDQENKTSNEADQGTSTSENHSIEEVKTTDSGYMSPPEAQLDADLQHDEPQDSLQQVIDDFSALSVTGKIPAKPETELETFNSFNYWRIPLPQIDSEGGEAKTAEGATSTAKDSVEDEKEHAVFQDQGISEMDDEDGDENDIQSLLCDEQLDSDPLDGNKLSLQFTGIHGRTLRFDDDYLQPYSPNMSFEEDTPRGNSPPPAPTHVQSVIPQALLDHYISMTEPSKAQAIDTELAKHCAFSFPAVTLTLGSSNWPCLRDTYEQLSSDMQWKVRRTLAFSIHVLSRILGEDITRADLVPIFDNFLKDLDEVRIGILKHLANFIQLLAPDLRASYLAVYSDFLKTDNARNWRFRYELAEQLIILCDVYNADEVNSHICPIALILAADQVAEVRQIAFKLIGILLLKLDKEEDKEKRSKFTEDIVEHFARSLKWHRRLSFGQLCEVLLEEDFITAEKFAVDFLPELLNYQSDKIVNVKVALSRTLTRAVMATDYFCRPECKDSEQVLAAIEKLQSDNDRDVRFFAGRQEEVPYEGTIRSADNTVLCRAVSRESFGDVEMDASPLGDEFAEQQIEAKLLAVETNQEDTTLTGVPVEETSPVDANNPFTSDTGTSEQEDDDEGLDLTLDDVNQEKTTDDNDVNCHDEDEVKTYPDEREL